MDLTALRELIRPHVIGIMDSYSHARMSEGCERIGLPEPPPDGSKRERLSACFRALPNESLPAVAERILQFHQLAAQERNELQDFLWEGSQTPEIPMRARRDIARTLQVQDLYTNAERFNGLLDRLWILDDDPFTLLTRVDNSLRAHIGQHVHARPPTWSVEELFEKLGAFDAPNRRFALFLEGLASSDVQPDEADQRRFVEAANGILRRYGTELRETATKGGYSVFTVLSYRGGGSRAPKNLIFASAEKPDIRFRSAVDNDIEIVANADKVLVYDLPINAGGLLWCDLQRWWADTREIQDEKEAKRTLYVRLRECLPKDSPPQLLLFESFYSSFGKAIPDLPALLPEVWLHWDPKTVKERGPDALLRFRMDFLLLLPQGVRIVVEVDGKQHYANEKGEADVTRYASMLAADRDLKLSSYEVFRFGGKELQGDAGRKLAKDFFVGLFKKYGVVVPDPATAGV